MEKYLVLASFWFCLLFALRASAMELKCPDCNVVFIGFDSLQAKHVSGLSYRRNTTPTLDALAKDGVLFTRAYSVASWTVPSFMSFFTSLEPSEHHVVNKFMVFDNKKQIPSNLHKLSPQVETMAQAFHNAGYRTGGFTGDAGVGAVFGYDSGFEKYTDEKTFGSFQRSADHALKWLRTIGKQKFFLFFHGYDAHGQFSELPPNYRSRYLAKDYKGRYQLTPQEQRNLREDGLAYGKVSVTADEEEAWNAWYDGKIHDADDKIGEFLAELKKMGLLEKTLIVAVSDHGTEFFEHGRMDHGFSLYDELLRVPIVIKWPHQTIGKEIPTQIRSIDLLPTIFEIVGLKTNEKWTKQIHGKSLLPVITGEDRENRPVFSETDYRNYTHKRSLIDLDRWKLIVTMETGGKELYNLSKDPEEKNNLATLEAKRVYEMTQILYKQMKDSGQKPLGPWTIGCLPVYLDQCRGAM